nr:hypothetical protein B17C10.280 [imported] - Neurospora crassa [Neurospora crassa]
MRPRSTTEGEDPVSVLVYALIASSKRDFPLPYCAVAVSGATQSSWPLCTDYDSKARCSTTSRYLAHPVTSSHPSPKTITWLFSSLYVNHFWRCAQPEIRVAVLEARYRTANSTLLAAFPFHLSTTDTVPAAARHIGVAAARRTEAAAVGTAVVAPGVRHTEAAAGHRELPAAVVRTRGPADSSRLLAADHTGHPDTHVAAAGAVRTALAVHIVPVVLRPGEEHTGAADQSEVRCRMRCYRKEAADRAGFGRRGHVGRPRRKKGYCCRCAIGVTGAIETWARQCGRWRMSHLPTWLADMSREVSGRCRNRFVPNWSSRSRSSDQEFSD